MDSMTGEHMPFTKGSRSNQAGFTLVETMFAIIILSGGLLALASAFAQGMVVINTTHYHQIAKEKASEAIESVFTSRDTRTITWAQIRNARNGGVFLDGEQQLRAPGNDGLVNTADDGVQETEVLPGNDGRINTGDDVVFVLSMFTREIEITDIAQNLRQIRVIVRYQVGHLTREYQLVAYISSFA
jgi:prepilin-type N-terminal cleavage/methylation domain-containing protein